VLARYGYAGCVNDMGFDTASPEPARQPEAVTAAYDQEKEAEAQLGGVLAGPHL
jgi:hypothetical protein